MNEEQAILFVMEFYQVSREDACELYQDEIKAYMWLNDSYDEEGGQKGWAER